MTHTYELPLDGEMGPDYGQKIPDLFAKYPEADISDDVQRLLATQLTNLWYKYGQPESDTYRFYHNDVHTLDDIERFLMLMSIWSKMPGLPKPTKDDYEIGTIGLGYHDDELEVKDGKTPEERSAENMAAAMRMLGRPEEDIQRAIHLINATKVIYENGRLRQLHVMEGKRDIVVVTGAIADIGGIVFEGGQRMIQDVLNLTMERSEKGVLSKEILMGLLKEQYSFITQRLTDLSDYIAFLCEQKTDEAQEIFETIIAKFENDYKQALMVAEAFKDHAGDFRSSIEQELEKPIGGMRQQREKIRRGIIAAWRSLQPHPDTGE